MLCTGNWVLKRSVHRNTNSEGLKGKAAWMQLMKTQDYEIVAASHSESGSSSSVKGYEVPEAIGCMKSAETARLQV